MDDERHISTLVGDRGRTPNSEQWFQIEVLRVNVRKQPIIRGKVKNKPFLKLYTVYSCVPLSKLSKI